VAGYIFQRAVFTVQEGFDEFRTGTPYTHITIGDLGIFFDEEQAISGSGWYSNLPVTPGRHTVVAITGDQPDTQHSVAQMIVGLINGNNSSNQNGLQYYVDDYDQLPGLHARYLGDSGPQGAYGQFEITYVGESEIDLSASPHIGLFDVDSIGRAQENPFLLKTGETLSIGERNLVRQSIFGSQTSIDVDGYLTAGPQDPTNPESVLRRADGQAFDYGGINPANYKKGIVRGYDSPTQAYTGWFVSGVWNENTIEILMNDSGSGSTETSRWNSFKGRLLQAPQDQDHMMRIRSITAERTSDQTPLTGNDLNAMNSIIAIGGWVVDEAYEVQNDGDGLAGSVAGQVYVRAYSNFKYHATPDDLTITAAGVDFARVVATVAYPSSGGPVMGSAQFSGFNSGYGHNFQVIFSVNATTYHTTTGNSIITTGTRNSIDGARWCGDGRLDGTRGYLAMFGQRIYGGNYSSMHAIEIMATHASRVANITFNKNTD